MSTATQLLTAEAFATLPESRYQELVDGEVVEGMPPVVYPRARCITVHTADGLGRTYGPEATLERPDLLPGFRLLVRELFG